MLARLDAAPVAPARGLARAAAAARLAHAGVLVAAAFLPLSRDVPEYALLASILGLAAARVAGLEGHRPSPLDVPVGLAVAATVAALVVALVSGVPAPPLEPATRFRAYLAPVVVLSALSLPLPADGPDAPRGRAVRALLVWSVSALAASAVGIVQGVAGVDPLFALGVRGVERLPPVPGWPGHFAATGFFAGYGRFGQNLLPPLLLAAALALGVGLPARRRLLLATAASAAAAAVVLTALRSGWASLALGALTLAALSGGKARRAALAAAAAALGLALLHPGLRIRVGELLAGGGNDDRRMIWTICGAIYRDHPLGIGPGSFDAFAREYWAALAPGTVVMPGCHATPFQLLVDGGPLLAGACLVAAILVVRPFWRAARDGSRDALARAAAIGALAGLVALGLSGLVHDVHRAIQVSYSAGVTLGLAAALALPRRAR